MKFYERLDGAVQEFLTIAKRIERSWELNDLEYLPYHAINAADAANLLRGLLEALEKEVRV